MLFAQHTRGSSPFYIGVGLFQERRGGVDRLVMISCASAADNSPSALSLSFWKRCCCSSRAWRRLIAMALKAWAVRFIIRADRHLGVKFCPASCITPLRKCPPGARSNVEQRCRCRWLSLKADRRTSPGGWSTVPRSRAAQAAEDTSTCSSASRIGVYSPRNRPRSAPGCSRLVMLQALERFGQCERQHLAGLRTSRRNCYLTVIEAVLGRQLRELLMKSDRAGCPAPRSSASGSRGNGVMPIVASTLLSFALPSAPLSWPGSHDA